MGKGRILVVEDNLLSLELVTDILDVHGYEVIQARSAWEAMERVNNAPPDLIVMDLQLPDMDGLTLIQMLRKYPRTKDISIIAVTARAMKGDEAKAREAGCSAYISKPIDPRTFPMFISEFLAGGKS